MARKVQGSVDISQINGEDLASAALPVTMAAVPTGGATADKQDTIIGHVDGIEATLTSLLGSVDGLEALATALNGFVDGLEGKDFSTETTLAALLAKVIAAPATEANQATLNGHVDGIETSLTTLIGHVDLVETKQDAANTLLQGIVDALIATATLYNWLLQGSNNAGVMKNSPGTLLALNCNNVHSTDWIYCKFYDRTTAPDPATHVPVLTLAVPPLDKVHLALPTNGAPFATGLSYLIVKGAAHTNNTAVDADQGIMFAVYR